MHISFSSINPSPLPGSQNTKNVHKIFSFNIIVIRYFPNRETAHNLTQCSENFCCIVALHHLLSARRILARYILVILEAREAAKVFLRGIRSCIKKAVTRRESDKTREKSLFIIRKLVGNNLTVLLYCL